MTSSLEKVYGCRTCGFLNSAHDMVSLFLDILWVRWLVIGKDELQVVAVLLTEAECYMPEAKCV